MKRKFLSWMIVGGGACLATAIIHPNLAHSADHLDAPGTVAEPAADINDLYTFLDGTSAVFAMTVFPAAPGDAKFSDTVQYVVHTTSGAAFGAADAGLNIICTFDAAQRAQCWAGADEYVTGDASGVAGIKSVSGKVQIFAGVRADPFFFNRSGFNDAVTTMASAAPALTFNGAGCPAVTSAQSSIFVGKLSKTDGGPAVDFFKTLNVLAIVVKIDKTLVTKGGQFVSAWGRTYRKTS